MKRPFHLPWILAVPVTTLSVAATGLLIWANLGISSPGDRKASQAYADAARLTQLFRDYKAITGKLPSDDQGFDALIKCPEESIEQLAKMLDTVPWDPWGNRYQYRRSLRAGVEIPEVISAGKDGMLGTDDDLSSLDPPY